MPGSIFRSLPGKEMAKHVLSTLAGPIQDQMNDANGRKNHPWLYSESIARVQVSFGSGCWDVRKEICCSPRNQTLSASEDELPRQKVSGIGNGYSGRISSLWIYLKDASSWVYCLVAVLAASSCWLFSLQCMANNGI